MSFLKYLGFSVEVSFSYFTQCFTFSVSYPLGPLGAFYAYLDI